MKSKYLLITLLLTTGYAFAQVKQSVTKANISFQIKNMGFNTGGTIGGVQADIVFDTAKLDASLISASADINTINTDNDMRDEHLKKDSYFDAARYPKITMKSVNIKHKSGDNYIGQFSVTIKDKTHLLDVPFTYIETGSTATFNGTLKLKRSDFGIGGSSMVMSDDVTVKIVVETGK